MKLKIGILLPRSDMFPTLARDFLNGLKLAFTDHGNNFPVPHYLVESIGNATGDSVLKVAEKMLIQDEVDLVISFCSYFTLEKLVSLFNSYQKPLIHIDLGGNILKKEHVSPYVIHQTLNLSQSSYNSGLYAANLFGKKAALVVSFYDGGYHLTESFVRGFTENGGSVVYNYVSPFEYKSESFDSMLDGIEKSNPDFIYLLFSYKEGNKIFETFAQSDFNGKIPFLASPLMTDETNNTINYNIENVVSVASWAMNEESELMNRFIKSYLKTYNSVSNIISLLAFETGLVLSNILKTNNEIPAKIGEYLYARKINTPRGELTYNAYHESEFSSFKIRNFLFRNLQAKNQVVDSLDFVNKDIFYEKFKDLPFSGWQNPYIIT